MIARKLWWQKIPPLICVGIATGGTVGGWLGYLVCFAYNFWNGPFLPQAVVDPNPAGWEGWWIGGAASNRCGNRADVIVFYDAALESDPIPAITRLRSFPFRSQPAGDFLERIGELIDFGDGRKRTGADADEAVREAAEGFVDVGGAMQARPHGDGE